ncbi:MAG TPA: endonuclease/exonuclease/phosphatase family protein, partial [Dehalococcoidia bacterium]
MPRVKVATLNLFNRMSDWESRLPLVVDQLEKLMPDVIGFQEVDLMIDQGMEISRAVNERLAEEPHYRIKHATTPGLMASIFGIGTLAKIECVEHEVLDLMSFDRIAQRMVYTIDDARFALVNTHLHHPPEAVDERAEQAECILRWLDRHDSLPTVVSGDFNSYEGERT